VLSPLRARKTDLLLINIDGFDRRVGDASVGNLLVDVNALADEIVGRAPHVRATKVLVLEVDLDVFRAIFVGLDL